MVLELDAYRPADRYAGKARGYARFRPSYPRQVIETLRAEGGLSPGARLAELGAGTGIFTGLLLDAGWQVHAVEPNPEMRATAEAALADRTGFVSVAGSAEATTLDSGEFDAVVCAQAFHWFDPARAVPEMRRVLRPGGLVGLLWNETRHDADRFHQSYQELLRTRCPDHQRFQLAGVSHSVESLSSLFGVPVRLVRLDNHQDLSLEGLQGRVASMSFCPAPGTAEYAHLMTGLTDLFARHHADGIVRIRYDVALYCLSPA